MFNSDALPAFNKVEWERKNNNPSKASLNTWIVLIQKFLHEMLEKRIEIFDLWS